MSTYYYNGELYHHGVAGQKWGVQNGPPYPLDSGVSKSNATRKYDTGKITGKIKSAASSVKNKVSSIGKSKNKNQDETKKKKISEMSDNELKSAVDRLNLENQYYTLSGKVASATESKGHKYVSQFMNKATNSVIDAATSAIGSKVKNYLNNAMDVDGSKAKQEAKEAADKQKANAEKKAAKAQAKAETKSANAELNKAMDATYKTVGDSKQSAGSNTSSASSTKSSGSKVSDSMVINAKDFVKQSSNYDTYTFSGSGLSAKNIVSSMANQTLSNISTSNSTWAHKTDAVDTFYDMNTSDYYKKYKK